MSVYTFEYQYFYFLMLLCCFFHYFFIVIVQLLIFMRHHRYTFAWFPNSLLLLSLLMGDVPIYIILTNTRTYIHTHTHTYTHIYTSSYFNIYKLIVYCITILVNTSYVPKSRFIISLRSCTVLLNEYLV